MHNKLNIPKTIHAGFQKRKGTYTGKLAYVIYTDEKGKKRKETSWQRWKDGKIPIQDFNNIPTEGFVLNKGVGGTRESYGWNARNEYIRIYDPRDFEFEISVANLLFILQECTSTKGKGLEGEFVYSWSGTELVLLPVCSAEYKESVEFTSLKSLKITKKDMTAGHTYQDKDMNNLIYLGRHAIRNLDNLYGEERNKALYSPPDKKTHAFYSENDANFVFQTGFTKLAKKVSDEVHSDYATYHQILLDSLYCSPFKQRTLKRAKNSTYQYYGNNSVFINKNDKFYLVPITTVHQYYRQSIKAENIVIERFPCIGTIKELNSVDPILLEVQTSYYGDTGSTRVKIEELLKVVDKKDIYTLKYEFESAETTGVPGYVE